MTTAGKPAIETLNTSVVYQNRWMKVREDGIRRQDGSESIYGVVEKPDFVVVVPLEDDSSLHLVEQYRYPVKGRFWELPQGAWEQQPDADPIEVARGELREETGLETGELIDAGHLFQAYGYAVQGYHVFLARRLRYVGAEREATEQDLVTRCFPFADVLRMILVGQIKDATTIAALGLLQMKGMLRAVPA